eukprot:TRINITY_DN6717_c0_g2_i4.p3 TRINITY_DN6717_c0_g2~~TRINITY_DN6717_c0_g2_i4.p3  ORF type:complete len:220 (-),score=-6.12 TRINITY_DN6717_c0_g2_i4:428-1087(-)
MYVYESYREQSKIVYYPNIQLNGFYSRYSQDNNNYRMFMKFIITSKEMYVTRGNNQSYFQQQLSYVYEIYYYEQRDGCYSQQQLIILLNYEQINVHFSQFKLAKLYVTYVSIVCLDYFDVQILDMLVKRSPIFPMSPILGFSPSYICFHINSNIDQYYYFYMSHKCILRRYGIIVCIIFKVRELIHQQIVILVNIIVRYESQMYFKKVLQDSLYNLQGT